MRAEELANILGSDFYVGVPDSQLKALCEYLLATYGVDAKHHIIAANEGNCVALAAGYYLATRKPAIIYMQNSGEGNAVNPIASLLKIYGIPVIFVIGWRGEPGVHDEPQHIYQGEMTVPLLDLLGISHFVISKETTTAAIVSARKQFEDSLQRGESVAFVVRKDALEYDGKVKTPPLGQMKREDILRHVLQAAEGDILVSTTGKTSREIFELREKRGEGHAHDFLTVGSMGHSSSIALGIAIQKPDRTVWCIDGDGAVLMHMGALAVIGVQKPKNFIHVVINNGAHESVGGMPTVMRNVDLSLVARGCGYPSVVRVDDAEGLENTLSQAKTREELTMIEVMSAVGARSDLGRPTASPEENLRAFMKYLG